MRRLILMRHAKSSWSDRALADHDRPLNGRGRRACALIGTWLVERGYEPGHALLSSSERTRETWQRLAAFSRDTSTDVLRALYHADAETMLLCLRSAPDAETVLLLGHQPGIGRFAHRVIGDPPRDEAFAKFPTAAVAVIDLVAESWDAADWGLGQLHDFVVPRSLE